MKYPLEERVNTPFTGIVALVKVRGFPSISLPVTIPVNVYPLLDGVFGVTE